MIQTPRLILQPVLPELILAGVAMVGLLYEAFARRSRVGVHLGIALVGLLGAAVAAWRLWDWSAEPVVLGGAVAADRFAVVGVLIVVVSAAIGCLIAAAWFDRDPERRARRALPLDPVRRVGDGADRGRERPDRDLPRPRDPVALALRADRARARRPLDRGRR